VTEALDLVGLTAARNLYPHEVSGGMQQRANLARALVVDPQLLLMDEPFGALDALTRETMQDELSALIARTNRTTFFITHDIEEAILLADTVLVMAADPGRIVERITVPFPKPRSRDVVSTPEFEELARTMRRHLRGTAATPVQQGQ
jgi:NitT/TauT family transport system ATP-binding protein